MNLTLRRCRSLASAAQLNAWDNLAPNLVIYSDDMTQGQWTTATLTSILATSIIEDSGVGAQHRADQAYTYTASKIYTLQVQASAGTRSWLRIRIGSNNGSHFDLTNCVVGTSTTILTATITPAGAGRVNISLSCIPDANFIRIGLATGDNGSAYNGDGVSGANIHRVQLTQRPLMTRYIRTVATIP